MSAPGTQSGARGADRYYNIYTEDQFANERFGIIDRFTEHRYDTATSGTIAIDKNNGQVQNIALTGDLTISGFSNFYTGETVGSKTKQVVDTVTVVLRQDGTGRTVTLPTGANYFYAGENSTVETTASSVTMLSVTAIDNGGTDQYLITVSPAFVAS